MKFLINQLVRLYGTPIEIKPLRVVDYNHTDKTCVCAPELPTLGKFLLVEFKEVDLVPVIYNKEKLNN